MPTPSFGQQCWTSTEGFIRSLIALIAITLLPFARASTSAEERWDIRTLHKLNGGSFQEVRDILEDEKSGIWIATWGGGVTHIQGTEWQTYDELNGLPSNWVRSLEMDGAGGIWVGTTRGLCRIRGGKLDVFSMDNVAAFPVDSIHDVERLRDGSIWISFDGPSIVLSYQENAEAPDPCWKIVAEDWEVQFIEQTRDGRVWISNCKTSGLRYYEGNHWHDVNLEKATRPVEGIFQDSQGTVFALTDATLSRITTDYETSPEPPFDTRVLCADESPSGRLYVGTHGKVFVKGQAWTSLDIGGLYRVRKVLLTRDGSSLWIGTMSGVLHGTRFSWRRNVTNTDGNMLVPKSLSVSRFAPPLCMDDEGRINLFQRGRWSAVSEPIAIDGAPQFVLRDGPNQICVLGRTALYFVRLPDGHVERHVPVSHQMIHPVSLSGTPG